MIGRQTVETPPAKSAPRTPYYTHTQIEDKVKALDALPPANPDEQDEEQSAVA